MIQSHNQTIDMEQLAPLSTESSDDFRYLPTVNQTTPEYFYDTFPEGETFPNLQNTSKSLDISWINRKVDKAFQHSLSKVDWQLFLTLKFLKKSFNSLRPKATWERKRYVWWVMSALRLSLGLSRNDIQYFCTEESNENGEAHYHILIHCVYPHKVSVQATRSMLLHWLDPWIVTIPKKEKKDLEEPHLQTIRDVSRTVSYVLKLPLDQHEPKPFFHSFKFVRFYQRYLRWKNNSSNPF